MIKILKTKQDIVNFANQLVKTLGGNHVVGLIGEIGVGKTFFTKALGQALGVKEIIKSPSFNLMKIYETRKQKNKKIIPRLDAGTKKQSFITTLAHIDCYRLDSADELIDIGFFDYLKQKNTLIVVEWADKIKKILPKDTVWLKFRFRENGAREVEFK